MAMIKKINELKSKTESTVVKALCESALNTISSAIYNGVTPDAKFEIERVTVNNLFEELSKQTKDSVVNEWLATEKRLYTVKNLGVRDSINTLNETRELKQVLSAYKEALDNGVHETRLYEQFITALSPFGYFPTVGNAIQSIKDRVDAYKTDVDIIKILETMKESRSNYLVPLIEDVINNYLSNKTMQTKSQLTETLMKFTYDPFVRDIASILTLDATELQLEYANAECDIEKVYSPVLYIGENEAVFAVKNVFYVKKGNNISKLNQSEVQKLDEEFKSLCEALSGDNIVIEKNGISIYLGGDSAFISEGALTINGQAVNENDFAQLYSVSDWAGNKSFYHLVEFVRSNFNEIAEIDFVKRVYLKEDQNHSADVFKCRDNVFITTHDSTNAKSTFYRNVNPMQAKNIMMEHLHYDVTSLYKGLLPDEEKINEQISETKEEYNTYIADLTKKISDFKRNPYRKDLSQKVVEALEEELKEVKDEYKDYLNNVERYFRAESVNEEVTIDVTVNGKKYTVPIPSEATGGNGEQVDTDGENQAGSVVGSEYVEDQPASAITFDDDQTELISDAPTIPEDKIDLGSDEAEKEAEEAEEEAEEKEEEEGELEDTGEEGGLEDNSLKTDDNEIGDEEDNDIKIEDEIDLDTEDQDELKSEDEEDEEDKKKKKKELPLESNEGDGLKKKKFLREDGEMETGKKKKRVFLKKKVSESVNESKKASKKEDKKADKKEDKKTDKKTKEDKKEQKKPDVKKKSSKKLNEMLSINESRNSDVWQIIIENEPYFIFMDPQGNLRSFDQYGEEASISEDDIQRNSQNAIKVPHNQVPQKVLSIIDSYAHQEDDLSVYSTRGEEEDEAMAPKEKSYVEMGQNEKNFLLNQAIDSGDWEKAAEIAKYMKESVNESFVRKTVSEVLKWLKEGKIKFSVALQMIDSMEMDENHKTLFTKIFKLFNGKKINFKVAIELIAPIEGNISENAQVGTNVMLDKEKGYVIGQTNNGDLIVQIQGSTKLAKPNEVKPVGEVKSQEPTFKFDKETLQNLTTKALFEQYIRCGIFVESTPVKTSNCYVRYSDWKDAKDDDNLNVVVEGHINILRKDNIKIFEDVNDFANLENYVDGVEIDEVSGDIIGKVKINAKDYTEAVGDAAPVRIIRGDEATEPRIETVPRVSLNTLSV